MKSIFAASAASIALSAPAFAQGQSPDRLRGADIIVTGTRSGDFGAQLAEVPDHSAAVATRLSVGTLELRANANHVGARKVINGGAVTLPDYLILDLGVGRTFGRFRVDAALSNLFGDVYYYSDNTSRYSLGTEDRVFPGEPRTLSVRVRYNLGASGL